MALFGDEDPSLEEVLAALPYPGLVVDADGRIRTANERASLQLADGEALAGRTLGRVLPGGLPEGDLGIVDVPGDDGGTRTVHVGVGSLEDGSAGDRLVTLLDPDRLPAPDQPRETPGAESEDGLGADTDLQAFVRGVSHDLKNPLTVVKGHLELMEIEADDSPETDDREHISEALDALDRAERLLEGLSTYARLGETGPERGVVNLEDVIRDAVSNVPSDRTVDAEVEVAELPSVAGHRVALIQLFQNLVANGLTYNEEAPRRVSITSEPDADGSLHRITVRDNGIGIPPADLDRIFEPFERGQAATTEGEGIGLALCQRIVEEHGGRIEVESTVGEGSTFHVYLPGADALDTEDAGAAEPTDAGESSHDEGLEADDPTSVVLIDDVAGIRSLIGKVLERTGRYEVVDEAGSGRAGIEVVEDVRPELVLLDLSMPEMDGLEALPHINDVAPDTDVVIYSGFEQDRMAETAIERGAVGYIEKGGDPEEIIEQLESVLEETSLSVEADD